MPLFDNNTKIESLRLGPTEIIEVRLGGTPIFPDSVGAPVINGFTSPYDAMNPISRNGGIATLTVSGVEGATFSVSVNITDVDDQTGIIPEGQTSTTVSFVIPSTANGNSVNHIATISAIGISILDENLTTSVIITQEAALAHGISSDFTPDPNFVGINLGFISPSSLPFLAFTITVTRAAGLGGFTFEGFSNHGGNNITVSPTSSSSTSQAIQVTVVGGAGTGNEGGVRITRPGYTTYQQEVIEWGIG